MSLNPTFLYRAPQNLVVPNGTGGWKTVGTLMNGVAGYMTWRDKKKQAEKMQEAQDNYYNALMKYLEGKKENTPSKPVEVAVAEQQKPSVTNEPIYDYEGRNDISTLIELERQKQERPYKRGMLSYLPDQEKSSRMFNVNNLLGGF